MLPSKIGRYSFASTIRLLTNAQSLNLCKKVTVNCSILQINKTTADQHRKSCKIENTKTVAYHCSRTFTASLSDASQQDTSN